MESYEVELDGKTYQGKQQVFVFMLGGGDCNTYTPIDIFQAHQETSFSKLISRYITNILQVMSEGNFMSDPVLWNWWL